MKGPFLSGGFEFLRSNEPERAQTRLFRCSKLGQQSYNNQLHKSHPKAAGSIRTRTLVRLPLFCSFHFDAPY